MGPRDVRVRALLIELTNATVHVKSQQPSFLTWTTWRNHSVTFVHTRERRISALTFLGPVSKVAPCRLRTRGDHLSKQDKDMQDAVFALVGAFVLAGLMSIAGMVLMEACQ